MSGPLAVPEPLPGIAYPPAPWDMIGLMWAGVFVADRPLMLPEGQRHLLGPRLVMLSLVRYYGSELAYDEIVFSSLVRSGWHVGILAQSLWVDSLTSIAGGRALWGLDKQMASFTWGDRCVEAADEHGVIARLRLSRPGPVLPPLPVAVDGVGLLTQGWVRAAARGWACLGGASMRLESLSERFPFRLPARPLFSAVLAPFRLSILPAAAIP